MTQERAVAYLRLSQEGKSIPEQREMCEDYCRERGLELVQVYSDGEHASGYTDDREQYQALLDRLNAGDVGHVVVRGLSRLSRDRHHRLELLLQLHREDVDVHAVDRGDRNPVDLSEPWALTREAGQADADDVEKRKEAERGRAEAERRDEQQLPNGRPPFGLEYGPERERFVPGDGFEDAVDAIEARKDGLTWREVQQQTGVNKDTASRIFDRREEYLEHVEQMDGGGDGI